MGSFLSSYIYLYGYGDTDIENYIQKWDNRQNENDTCQLSPLITKIKYKIIMRQCHVHRYGYEQHRKHRK